MGGADSLRSGAIVHRLLILSKHAAAYRDLVGASAPTDLEIASASNADGLPESAATCDIVFGEPSLIRAALPRLTAVRWVQSTWAGVEPLLDPALRRDYALTNARGVF